MTPFMATVQAKLVSTHLATLVPSGIAQVDVLCVSSVSGIGSVMWTAWCMIYHSV